MAGVGSVLFTVLIRVAIAGDADLVRDLDGEVVRASEEGTLIVFFSMADPEAPESLHNLALRQAAGEPVLAVSVDGAAERARLRPYLAGHGLRGLRVAHDPLESLCARLGVGCGEAVLVRYEGHARVQWRGPSPSEAPNRPEEVEPLAVLDAFGLGEPPSLVHAWHWLAEE